MKNKELWLLCLLTSSGLMAIICGTIALVYNLFTEPVIYKIIVSTLTLAFGCFGSVLGIIEIKDYFDDMRFAKSVMLSQGKVKIINDKDIR